MHYFKQAIEINLSFTVRISLGLDNKYSILQLTLQLNYDESNNIHSIIGDTTARL